MKKMLRFDMCGSVEVPADFPIGPLYDAHGRKVGEVVPQIEASELSESGALLQRMGLRESHTALRPRSGCKCVSPGR